MQKKGAGTIFDSKDGRVGLALLVSVLLIFVSVSLFVNALTITNIAPGNLSYNGTRNVNFTFTPTWSNPTETISNCSIYVNTTGAWVNVKNLSRTSGSPDDSVTNASTSYGNFTFSSDGNFTFNIGCFSQNATGALNFSGGEGGSGNRTFFLDSVAPQVGAITPGTFIDGAFLNITSYQLATFYVNVTDNSTRNVFLILDNLPSTVSAGDLNESVNRTMILNSTLAMDRTVYNFSIAGLLDFNSSFTGPGAHSVIFCANDSLSRITCSAKKDFIVMGGNITQMEKIFSTMQQGTGFGFGGLNITYGNGTEIPDGTFFSPVPAAGGVLNYTFIFNFSSDAIISIVGGSIDEKQFGNASNARINSTPTREVSQQLGTGYTGTTAWADISSFIPDNVRYLYGIIQLRGTSFSKRMYCNGTTMSNPQCHTISQCNATTFGIFNSSRVIPSGDGCWLESGLINNVSLASGYTYIFVTHFSGGIGGSDFSQVNVTNNAPLFNGINTSTASNLINFTLDDVNSTGLNLTINNSINVTIFQAGVQKLYFTYINGASTNLSCTSSDTVSPQNTTSVTCNVTFAFSNGTYVVNVTARDTSNNSNPANVSTSSITIKVDQIPPLFDQYNITHNTTTDFTNPVGIQLGLGNGLSTAQGRTIFPRANWTDNLTQPFQAAFQFFNQSANSGVGAWQTLSTTPSNTILSNQSNWANFSFVIPSSRNEFEGRNVSFRIIANDTLGNVNDSASVKNFTIQINDTYPPTISIPNGTVVVNGTNTTVTTPIISWLVNENNKLTRINVSVDANAFSGTGVDTNCGLSAVYTTAAGTNNVESHRNGTFTVSSDPACTLGNGTHFVNITAVDIWGNALTFGNTFTVQTGTPTISLSSLGNGLSAVNQSNVTISTGINFTAIAGASTGVLKTFTWTSSCNTSTQTISNSVSDFTVANLSFIYPFQNISSCANREANQTVTVTVADSAGNTQTAHYRFLVDDLGPSLSVNNPTSGFNGPNNIIINLSAQDGTQSVSEFGYFLDTAIISGTFVSLNASQTGRNNLSAAAANVTNSFNINFTPGTHTIKFRANDTLGNAVNSSVITFTALGPINFISIGFNASRGANTTLGLYNNIRFVNLSTIEGSPLENTRTVTDANLSLLLALNNTPGKLFNVTFKFNGSAANWDKYNFSVTMNNSDVRNGISVNQSAVVLNAIFFNDSVDEFLPDSAYYGIVQMPGVNLSNTFGGTLQIWYFAAFNDTTSKVNVTACSSSFAPSLTSNSGMPCWNNTDNQTATVFVPHFSDIVLVNDTAAPTVNVTMPSPANPTTRSSFVPNITVSFDAATCYHSINGTKGNKTMTKSGNICIGPDEESFKNVVGNLNYSFVFWVIDESGNTNKYNWTFNVSDTTAPDNGAITSSPSTTSATVTITGTNESVNATVAYGTTNTSLGSVAMETDFDATQIVTISGLTASTTYYYNVTVCDYNGNCKTNITTFSFATSAAAAAAAASSSSSSGGGGSATGATTAATANEAASTSRSWDSLVAGSTGTFNINSEGIAFTGIVIAVTDSVSSPSVSVSSLTANPQSSAPSSSVYQYLKITTTNIADVDISKATVSFKVAKSWLTVNSVAEDNIALYRYHDGQWTTLTTTKTGSDADNVLFEAVTPGFSDYAIGTKSGVAPTTVPATTPAEQPALATQPAATTTPAEQPASATQPAAAKPVSNNTLAWIVVGIIVILAAIGFVVWQKKKSQ